MSYIKVKLDSVTGMFTNFFAVKIYDGVIVNRLKNKCQSVITQRFFKFKFSRVPTDSVIMRIIPEGWNIYSAPVFPIIFGAVITLSITDAVAIVLEQPFAVQILKMLVYFTII